MHSLPLRRKFYSTNAVSFLYVRCRQGASVSGSSVPPLLFYVTLATFLICRNKTRHNKAATVHAACGMPWAMFSLLRIRLFFTTVDQDERRHCAMVTFPAFLMAHNSLRYYKQWQTHDYCDTA
ncbi:hypothetical protein H4582DRAFT_1032377 [Lactarius indigo]|nr:hypothetical protein H4582DRAFT_1032377 [Lactarius indigo]